MLVQNKNQRFIKMAIEKHGDLYSYQDTNFVNYITPVIITCRIHGNFRQKPGNHLIGKGCPKCGRIRCDAARKLSQREFINRCINSHGNYYDYTKTLYTNCYANVTIGCPKHGYFQQVAVNHMSGRGCYKCNKLKASEKLRSNTPEFIRKAKLKHGDSFYSYDKTVYHNAVSKVIVTCNVRDHGDFHVTPNNHLSGKGCPKCKMSRGEVFIHQFLTENKINFVPQYRIPQVDEILFYDFYLPDKKLLIEFQGGQHFVFVPYFHGNRDKFLAQKVRDDRKKLLAKAWGYKLICISHEVFEKLSKEGFVKILRRKIECC